MPVKLDSDFPSLIARFGEETLLREICAATEEAILIIDEQQRVCYLGGRAATLFGYEPDEVLGQPVTKLCLFPHLLESSPAETAYRSALHTLTLLPKNGSAVEARCRVRPLAGENGRPTGMLIMVSDPSLHRRFSPLSDQSLTDALYSQVELTTTLSTQEGGLSQRELNHRIRNSLAMICALLEMEMLRAPEGERGRLQISLARIRSFALVHNLFLQRDPHTIEVGTLTRAVLDSVMALFGYALGEVALSCDHKIELDLRRGTYLGLVLTEIAVNFIRSSVACGRRTLPTLTISQSDGELQIVIEGDDMTTLGEYPAFDPLSREILFGLVERSLTGCIEIHDEASFRMTIRCPIVDEPISRS